VKTWSSPLSITLVTDPMRVGESHAEEARGWGSSMGVGASLVTPGVHGEEPALVNVIVPLVVSPHFN